MKEQIKVDEENMLAFMSIAREGIFNMQETSCCAANAAMNFKVNIMPYIKPDTKAGILDDFVSGLADTLAGISRMHSAITGAMMDRFDDDYFQKILKRYQRSEKKKDIEGKLKYDDMSRKQRDKWRKRLLSEMVTLEGEENDEDAKIRKENEKSDKKGAKKNGK